MIRAGGYGIVTNEDGSTIEYDTFTCGHDQVVVKLDPFMQPTTDTANGWCPTCNKPLCPACANRLAAHGCEIWEQQMDAAEARARTQRSIDEVLR